MSRLDTLIESRDAAQAELRTMYEVLDTATAESRVWTDEERTALDAVEQRLDQIKRSLTDAQAEHDAAQGQEEDRSAKLGGVEVGSGTVRVGKEPLTYGLENPRNSFYEDLLYASTPASRGFMVARGRLEQHQNELQAIARYAPGSPEGRAITRYERENRRLGSGHEQRTVSTSATSMGDFAPPLFFLTEWAPYRTYGRTLIDQMKSHPMPETGLTFNVPKITTPTEAQTQATQNTTVSTRTMVSTYESGTLHTIVDNLKVSQQYLDRVGPGINGDMIVRDDQQRQVNRTLNIFAWKTLLAAATHVTFATVTTTKFTAAKFNQAIHKAKAAIEKTDGLVAYPTHLFSDVDLWESVEGAYDKNNRPFVVPQGQAFNPLAVGDSTNVPEGYTGFRFASMPAFKDQANEVAWLTLQSATTTKKAQHVALVAALDISAYWLEGMPVIRVLPQPYANQLTVLIQEYVYCSAIVVYANGLQAVYGAGTATSALTA